MCRPVCPLYRAIQIASRFPHNPAMMTAEKKKQAATLILLAVALRYATICAFNIIADGWAFLIWETIGLCIVSGMLGIAHLLNRRRQTRPPAQPNPTGLPASGC